MSIALQKFIRRFAQDSSGVAAIEFAIVSVPLIMLILMTLECGIIFHITSLATEAANDAARVGKAGNLYDSTGTREALIMQRVKHRMSAWVTPTRSISIDHKSFGSFKDLGTTGTTGAGSGGQIVLYTISMNWPVISPPMQLVVGDTLAIKATALIKNEEF